MADEQGQQDKPNIVLILADDLGYGDVQCLNPKWGKIPTPNIDRLAAQGMTFTDAHSNSSVCTPTRYGLLTGRYSWRTRLQEGVLPNTRQPLIAKDRLTLAGMFKKLGYDTGAVGKWHLGWNCRYKADGSLDPTQPIGEGPITRGFDWYFGTLFDPGCFMENDRLIGAESLIRAEKGKCAFARTAVPDWQDEDMLPTFTNKAREYIRRQAGKKRPFFLYLAMTSPHWPIVPTPQWRGKSGLGAYGDFVMETDAMVGRDLAAVEETGIADNTLVLFTSDNGCTPGHNVASGMEKQGHYPSANMRGHKSDAWDGGHRIPLMVRWPGMVKPGSACGQLVCLNDLMATFAAATDFALPHDAAEDSVNFLSLLQGGHQPTRSALVHHSIAGKFAIRDGQWKLILCPGSGGWSAPKDAATRKQKRPAVQLFNMDADIGERQNLQAQHPEIVQRLTAELRQIVEDGRSTPGPKQKNDAAVDIFKKRQ